jgi:hypothetical protein
MQKYISGIRWFLCKSFNCKYLATDFTVKNTDFTAKIKKCIRETENQGVGYLIIMASGLWMAGSPPSADFQYSVVKEHQPRE